MSNRIVILCLILMSDTCLSQTLLISKITFCPKTDARRELN
jgi:hypothetical protein